MRVEKTCNYHSNRTGTTWTYALVSIPDLAEKSIKIDKKFIVFTVDAQNDLLNEYSTAFGSGLFVPAKPGPALAGGGPMGGGATDIGGKKPKLTLKK